MAGLTIAAPKVEGIWPNGTVVGAWHAAKVAHGERPSGTAHATATVTTGALVFTGLDPSTPYTLFALQPVAATAAAATDRVTAAGQFTEGEVVQFTALTGGAGLAVGTRYYVRNPTGAGTCQLSATPGGPPIDITTDLTAGTIRRERWLHATSEAS
jgi:hypothetical protein